MRAAVGSVDATEILTAFGLAVWCSRRYWELLMVAAEYLKSSVPLSATKVTDNTESGVADGTEDNAEAFGTADDALGVIRRRGGQQRQQTKWQATTQQVGVWEGAGSCILYRLRVMSNNIMHAVRVKQPNCNYRHGTSCQRFKF